MAIGSLDVRHLLRGSISIRRTRATTSSISGGAAHGRCRSFLRDYLYIPLGRPNTMGRHPSLREPDDHDGARRPLARRRPGRCHMGRAAQHLSLHNHAEINLVRRFAASCHAGEHGPFVLTFTVGGGRLGCSMRRR